VRIVTLLPSATEIVCTLGLEDQLVGITHECDYPPSVRSLPAVTRSLIPSDAPSAEIDRLVGEQMRGERSLYALDVGVLEALRPDLIVTQSLCGVCAVAEVDVRDAACTLPGRPRVHTLEPTSLEGVLQSIADLAAAADVPERATEVVGRLRERIDAVSLRTARLGHRPRTVLLEWIDPPFTCGHWSPELVRLAGGVEGLGRDSQPSRRAGWDEILEWRPEALVVACCGFDVDRTLRDLPILATRDRWSNLPCVRDDRVYVVDGSAYFSRPGPRLVDSLEILAHALHPTVYPPPAHAPAATRVSAASSPV
jgi:iron complex transport system substrate-binding protein